MRLNRTLIAPAAALVFGVCGVAAAASVSFILVDFAREGGVSPALLILVPGLFAMLFALTVYQGAATRVERMGQSLSRALLVALLTWIAFSALATAVWCPPHNFGSCFANALLVSGIIGGAPMLAAALVAGYVVGRLVLWFRAQARIER